ncbi:MAG: transmembrane sensor [Saprospiraceae bacterium]|jgi:transmembrane sensor
MSKEDIISEKIMSRDDYNSIEQFVCDASFVSWVESRKIDDKDHWEGWLLAHPDKASLVLDAELSILGVQFRPGVLESNDLEAALAKLHASLDHKVINIAAPKKQITRRRIGVGIAAVLVVLMLSTIAIRAFNQPIEVVHKTAYGEQMNLQLPDGSVVVLNANSTIRYFSNNTRNVWLEGEAFFEIEKKPETGEYFIVMTPDLLVTVLGTSFNVNARNDQTKVFLEEGRVELHMDDILEDHIEMDPGDEVTYSKKKKKLTEKRKNVSVLENASWKDGSLMFKKTPLQDALYDIEDIYGIHFKLESDELKQEEITGGIPIKNLKITLETLNEVYGIKIREEGKRYFISKGGE